jgi:hypothetical protein
VQTGNYSTGSSSTYGTYTLCFPTGAKANTPVPAWGGAPIDINTMASVLDKANGGAACGNFYFTFDATVIDFQTEFTNMLNSLTEACGQLFEMTSGLGRDF